MLLVSACLLGENCKYNGGNNRNEAVCRYLEGREYLAVCPECEGGLPTPRIPSERRGDRVFAKDGRDVTEFFQRGAELACLHARAVGADTAILKARSPSCGIDGIYDGTFTGTLIPGRGVTAEALSAIGLRLYSEEEIEALRSDKQEL